MAANFRRVRHEKAIGSGMSRRRFTRNGGQRALLAWNKGRLCCENYYPKPEIILD